MAEWGYLAVVSALFLAVYDLFRKSSLKGNAVLPVLYLSTLTSLFIFLPLILVSTYNTEVSHNAFWFVPSVPLHFHLFFILKALIVASSWVLEYYAIKHLPITIVTPIRSTGPVWTVTGAVLIYGEVMSVMQWIGVVICIAFLYLFSVAGKKENIHFHSNKWIWFVFAGTLIGAVSGLYDKYLISRFDRMAIQAWFAVYMVLVLSPLVYFMWYRKREKIHFHFRWSIIAIGVFLSISDFLYFYSLSSEGALISLVTLVRRANVVLSFFLAALIFKEGNIKAKSLALAGLLFGVYFILTS